MRTFPSGLESTSLLFVAGLDLFFNRVSPSGTFDILKEDFDHWFISFVLLSLLLASLLSKRLAKQKDLKQSWR
ncbi:unnamed protein product [Soboliphyme baturini]|uniref:ER membrane protein complex subunit 1 n=1 Tax=Soboliphyme baturini TaxID=241478 RepID=A0A183ITD3_9BILA|nr:unnamed protein product [Soboliphyme baturini]